LFDLIKVFDTNNVFFLEEKSVKDLID